MDSRCVCCEALYERTYVKSLYRLGSFSDVDYQDSLFKRFSDLIGIEEAGNYWFFSSLSSGLLKNKKIESVMSEDDLNISVEHIIQKTIFIYLKFHDIIDNDTHFFGTTFWYDRGRYYASTYDPTLIKFLNLICNGNQKDNVYKIDIETLNENIKEVWELIK